jgi:outer membrane protein OmpA-like peptidoglycan-associated protein
MRHSINWQRIIVAAWALVLLGSSGCATRRFVRNRVSETEAKSSARIGDVEKATSEKINAIDEKHQSDVSRLDEIAKGADNRAGQALQDASRANQSAEEAGRKAGESAQKAEQAQSAAAAVDAKLDNLGKLKMVASENVLFAFGSATLKEDEMAKLDAIAQAATAKFHTIEVHGFTDPVGDKSYNMNLSRQRAETVVRYLAQKHEIPLHRIQLMGFGSEPVEGTDEDMKPKERNRLSRRVEIRIFAPEDGKVQTGSL